jgi:hypothetical protein
VRALLWWMPQLIMVALGTAGATAAVAVQSGPLMVPCVVVAAVSGLAAFGSSIVKLEGPIPPRATGCKKCAALERDRDELRKALLELKP